MSSLTERPRLGGVHRGPRVGIVRGIQTSNVPVVADVRNHLPVEVLDPVDVQNVRDQAYREGFDAGYDDGLTRGQMEAQAAAAQAEARYASAMSALTAAVEDLRNREIESLHHVADQTALLALRIAEIVLQREIATAVDPGRDAIARAMPLVPEDGTVRIHLHPDDLEIMGPVGDLLPGREIELVNDASVTHGGCVVLVGATRVDAQIPAALGRVAEVLR